MSPLNSNPKISKAVIQDIIENTSELFESCGNVLQQALGNDSVVSLDCQKILNVAWNPFDGLQTEYLRQKQWEMSAYFIKPICFSVGTVSHRKLDDDNEIFAVKNCAGQMIPMSEVLKRFLELPNVFNTIQTFMEEKRISTYSIEIFTKIYV